MWDFSEVVDYSQDRPDQPDIDPEWAAAAFTPRKPSPTAPADWAWTLDTPTYLTQETAR